MSRLFAFGIVLIAALLAIPGLAASARQGQIPERSLVVTVVSREEIYVGDDRVAASRLVDEVDRRLDAVPPAERIVYVKSAPETDYGAVVDVLDALRARGIVRIGLIADEPAGATGSHDINRPDSQAEQRASELQGVIVEMRIDGRKRVQYRVAGRTVPVRRLTEAIREGLTGEPTGTVIIFAPRTMAYSQVVRVIDSAKRAGAANIGLQQQYAP